LPFCCISKLLSNFSGTARPSTRSYSDSPSYSDVKPVFDRIKAVSNPAIIKKIQAVFIFDIEGEGKWIVDLKNAKGEVDEADIKGDVTVTLNKDTFLKIFNREEKAATAFMNGHMKLSGDLSKAMALESMMKATRNA